VNHALVSYRLLRINGAASIGKYTDEMEVVSQALIRRIAATHTARSSGRVGVRRTPNDMGGGKNGNRAV
jgi:hypothetical protein